MQVFGAISLPLEKNYAVQHFISSLGTFKKLLQQDIDKVNQNKLRYQPVAASKEEEIVWLMFNYYKCTSEVKLNIK